MNLKLPAMAAAFLLASGCGALNGPGKSPTEPDVSSPVARAAASGASTAGTQQASAASRGGRTREEVHAEALEAAKHHKSTLEEELEFFNPYSH